MKPAPRLWPSQRRAESARDVPEKTYTSSLPDVLCSPREAHRRRQAVSEICRMVPSSTRKPAPPVRGAGTRYAMRCSRRRTGSLRRTRRPGRRERRSGSMTTSAAPRPSSRRIHRGRLSGRRSATCPASAALGKWVGLWSSPPQERHHARRARVRDRRRHQDAAEEDDAPPAAPQRCDGHQHADQVAPGEVLPREPS